MPEELALLIYDDEGADGSRAVYGHILVEGSDWEGGSLDKPTGNAEVHSSDHRGSGLYRQ